MALKLKPLSRERWDRCRAKGGERGDGMGTRSEDGENNFEVKASISNLKKAVSTKELGGEENERGESLRKNGGGVELAEEKEVGCSLY